MCKPVLLICELCVYALLVQISTYVFAKVESALFRTNIGPALKRAKLANPYSSETEKLRFLVLLFFSIARSAPARIRAIFTPYSISNKFFGYLAIIDGRN